MLTLDKTRFNQALKRAGYDTASQLAQALAAEHPNSRALSARKASALANAKRTATRAEQIAFSKAYGHDVEALFDMEGFALPLLTVSYRSAPQPIMVERPLSRAAVSRWQSQGVMPDRLLELSALLGEKPGHLLDEKSRDFLLKLLES